MYKLRGVTLGVVAALFAGTSSVAAVPAARNPKKCGRLFVERTYASDFIWDLKTNIRTLTSERIPQRPVAVVYPVPWEPTPRSPIVSPDGTVEIGPGGDVVSTQTGELKYRFPSEIDRTGNFGFTKGAGVYTKGLVFLNNDTILLWLSGSFQYATWTLSDGQITDLTDRGKGIFFVGTRDLVTLNGKRYVVAQTYNSDSFLLVDVLTGATSPVFSDGGTNAQITVVGDRIFGATSVSPYALRERTSQGIRVIAPLGFAADGKFKGELNEETNRILVRSGNQRQIVNYETGEVTDVTKSPFTKPTMVGLLRSGAVEATTNKVAFLSSNNRWKTLTLQIGEYDHGVSRVTEYGPSCPD